MSRFADRRGEVVPRIASRKTFRNDLVDVAIVAFATCFNGLLRPSENYDNAMFLLEKGFLDAVVPRRELKSYLSRALDFMAVPA